MRFDGYSFGTITINGVTYEHDVVIDGDTVSKRRKKKSKPFRDAYGYFNGLQFFNEFSLRGYRAKLAARQLPVWRGRRLGPREELCRDIMFSFKNAPELVALRNETPARSASAPVAMARRRT